MGDKVFVTELEAGALKTKAGLIIPDDDMKLHGIRNRWAKVWAIGPDVLDVKVGDWILIEHARWTNGIRLETPEGEVKVWRVDYPKHVFLVSDEDPRLEKF